MSPFRHMVNVGQQARVFTSSRGLTQPIDTVMLRLVGDEQCDASYCWQGQSNPPPGWLWQLWHSTSTRTATFWLPGILFSDYILLHQFLQALHWIIYMYNTLAAFKSIVSLKYHHVLSGCGVNGRQCISAWIALMGTIYVVQMRNGSFEC
jgi:hypothetical protein